MVLDVRDRLLAQIPQLELATQPAPAPLSSAGAIPDEAVECTLVLGLVPAMGCFCLLGSGEQSAPLTLFVPGGQGYE
jgi:hypothetical protein